MLQKQKLLQWMAAARVHMTVLASAVALCCGLTNTAQALSYSSISQVIFFGDSLTDSGWNDTWPGRPTGKAPTFTTYNGYTWSQYIASDIKGYVLPVYPGPNPADTITNNAIYPQPGFNNALLTGIDYAAAGSTTNSTGNGEVWAPSLVQQVTYYLATKGPAADPSAVYFIWEGANDFLILLGSGTLPTELQLLMTANTAAINIANQVGVLAARGATKFVVVALPNLGQVPYTTNLATLYNMPTLPATMKTLSFSFNSMLNQALGATIAKYGVSVLYVDTYDLFDNIISSVQSGQPYVVAGQSFSFVNYTTPACGAVQAVDCPNGAPNNYVFADTLHPTGMAHRVISLQVETMIQAWNPSSKGLSIGSCTVDATHGKHMINCATKKIS
jgi:outer membrane lipase/esterase